MKRINQFVGGLLTTLVLFQPLSVLALEKTETVYTNLDSYGVASKSIVNSHLYINEVGNVEDDTELRTLLNISGKEKYIQNERMLTWNATGKDIFYTGTVEKEQPVTIKTTYYLNDEEIKVEDMIGKKGTVKIVLNFTNNCYDETTGLYTPFVITMGTTIDSKTSSNILINNGKVINNGKTNMAVGIASPGLYNSLQIEEFKTLDQIIITYDTTKFTMNDMYIVATPKLLEDIDFSIFDKMSTLSSSIYTLQDSINQLENGAKQLSSGTASMQEGTNVLSQNLNNALVAVQKLENGSMSLDTGLNQVISALNTATETLQNKDVTGSLTNLQKLKEQNTNTITILTNTNLSLETTYKTYNLASFTEEQLKQTLASEGMDASIIMNLITCKKTYEGNQSLIELLSANNMAIDSTISSLTEISNQITSILTQLNTALVEIETGATNLSSGLTELKSGVNQLHEGAISLHTGAMTLNEGMNTLSNGITTINTQGIKKLSGVALLMDDYSYRTKQLVNLSKNYRGYGSNNSSNTTFIYRIRPAK